MTGYGKISVNKENYKFFCEIKSLNSKQLDIQFKLPNQLKSKEIETKNLVSPLIIRGKVEINARIEMEDVIAPVFFDINLAKKYTEKLKSFAHWNEISDSEILSQVLHLPGVITANDEEIDEEIWLLIQGNIKECLENFDQYRISEGEALAKALKLYISNISNFLKEIEKFEKQRIEDIRNRMSSNFNQLKNNIKIDEERFEQEVFFYIEKLDISEEKIRLKQHCEYFLDTLNDDLECGKKLSFISQEMGREINTIGSKANNIGIQKLVVQMKDELEKIKEQVNNAL
jgi:uncharacterized protein (TIGR00255 family)